MMRMSRRFVLKSMALSSVAGLVASTPLHALVGPAAITTAAAGDVPVLALVDGSMAEPIFLRGVLAGAGHRVRTQRASHDLRFLLSLERRLYSGQPLRIIGLLDDATATLAVDMARSAGAQVPWLGQHSTEAGFSRHHLITAPDAEPRSREFCRQLQDGEEGFSLNVEQCDGTVVQKMATPAQSGSSAAQWAADIGYLLAALGDPGTRAAPVTSPNDKPVTGSFVSFAIET